MRNSLIIILLWTSIGLQAQDFQGTTGLLHVPSAETDSAGTFRGGGMFLGKEFTPTQLNIDGDKYNTFSYMVGITLFRWLEVSYGAALLYMHKNADRSERLGYYNEDRRMNVKVVPLYEGKWWPGVAVGMDDIGRFDRIKSGGNANNYFQNIYGVVSKNFEVRGHRIGAHIGYRYYSSDVNSDRRGVIGGISYTPRLGERLQGSRAWLQRPRIILEWDGKGINVGGDVLLWRHLFIQAALIHGQGFMAGVSYHYTIKF